MLGVWIIKTVTSGVGNQAGEMEPARGTEQRYVVWLLFRKDRTGWEAS